MAQHRRAISSNQTRGYRLVGRYPVVQDSQQIQVDLPRGPHLESAFLRIAGTINNSVAFTTQRSFGSYYMFRNISWTLNSNVTLDAVSGPQALQAMFLTRRNIPVSALAAVGVGATFFEATVALDRAIMDMVRPKDSLLKTDVGVANNQLRVQLGALADMFTGAGTATYTSVNLEVWVTDYQEARNEQGQTPFPLWYAKRNGFQTAVLAPGNGQQIRLNTGNRLRFISARALDATTREPNTAITGIATGAAAYVTRASVKRAGDTRVDMPLNSLVRMGVMNYGAPATFTGLAALGMPGQFAIDFANSGQLGVRYSEFWPIPSSADTFLEVDVAASTVLEIVTLEGVDLPTAG